ncbi:phytoene/squalene synthase family protein [Brevirhabdus sp.]|uniref:phytoene/squalene synthase family protein n=1 Tax=Brevirhabdus sp. TaxID=2004514 RepID=UPI0040585579
MTVEACAGIVQRGDADRFLATMAAPPAARLRLFPLYAFNVEVSRAPWLTAEPMIAQMRLQWWRDVLDEIGAGGQVRRHEVATPLAQVLREVRTPMPELLGPLQALIDARVWDIGADPFADRAALEHHIDATAAGLMWVAGAVLGAGGTQDEQALRDVGRGAGMAGWLRAVPELRAAGRQPLPQETAQDTAQLIRALADDALARLRRGQRHRRAIGGLGGAAMLSAWQARRVLRLARRNPARVPNGGLEPSEFVRRGSLLLHALRRAP